jgi:predicted DNA-binding protein
MTPNDVKLSLRLPADLLERAEKLAKRLEADEEPVKVAVVIRRALRRGLDQLERETRRRRRR